MKTTEEKIDEFFRKRFNIEDNYIASRYTKNDRAIYDIEFIKQFINKNSTILDLGCGTGILEEYLAPLVAKIVGIDKYQEFLNKAYKAENIEYIASSFSDLNIKKQIDLILLFGITMYLSDEELDDLLKKVIVAMNKESIFIIKNQFGVEEEVIVDNFSEALQCDYYAKYRKLEDMCQIVQEHGFSCDVVDIYPTYINKYKNTHEYALVLKRKRNEQN